MQNFMKTIISAIRAWIKGEMNRVENKITASAADWNQNDPNADNYVKNRTHWEEEKVIVAECVVSGFSLMQESIYAVVNPFRMNPVVGDTYTVVWDGVNYDVKMRDLDGLGYIGNVNYVNMASGGNIPFAIVFAEDVYLITESPAASHTISISGTVAHKLDSKYLDFPDYLATTDDVQEAVDMANEAQNTADGKMDNYNPVGTGSFSMNRKSDTIVGDYSHAEGHNCTASGKTSHAEGQTAVASGDYSHAEGRCTVASGLASHAEGSGYSYLNTLTASGDYSHAEGYQTTAAGNSSHAEGSGTTASGENSHVQGKFNIKDTENKYAHIVGNGTSYAERSNAHTLDWEGVGWFQGGLRVGGNAQDYGAKTVLLEGDAIPVPASAEVGQVIMVKSVDENGKPVEWETDYPSGSGGFVVTGATVGQTVKISAVDENGVPTAWESVEFPSGGTDYEYITTVNIEEDEVVSYDLQLGADYRKVIITNNEQINNNSKKPITTASGLKFVIYHDNRYLASNSSDNPNTGGLTLNLSTSATTAERPHSFEIMDELEFIRATAYTAGILSGGLSGVSASTAIARRNNSSKGLRMNRIKIETGNSTSFFVNGIKLNVFGVRA